jgi:NADH-quinone oxidoreductase subunit F
MTTQPYILLRHRDIPHIDQLDVYLQHGGFQAFKKALTAMTPADVSSEVKNSGLRGRGGAGFPTGLKWSFLPNNIWPHYVVCNADESEPGTFKDREIMEGNPFQFLEGVMLCAYGVQASAAYIYLRGEFWSIAVELDRRIQQLEQAGYLGDNLFGTQVSLHLYTHLGAGAYICGEETAMLGSLEGARGHPKLKPPFPAVQGLYRKPTIINNVETLFNVPLIVQNGSDWYRQWGTDKSPGLKLFCVSGHVERPGVYELPLATPMRTLIDDLCGGPKDGVPLKAVIPGGSSTCALPIAAAYLCTLDYESIAEAGSQLGCGAVIAVNEQTCMVRLAERLASFYAHESCGKCIPCREGTDWLHLILARIEKGEGRPDDLPLLLDICDNMLGECFCPLGDAAATPLQASIRDFREEYETHVRSGGCLAGGAR